MPRDPCFERAGRTAENLLDDGLHPTLEVRVAPKDLDHRISVVELEGYVVACDERNVVDEYLLSEVAPHNVVLHVVADDSVLSLAEIGVDGGVMFAAVLADLADHRAAREDSRVLELLARVRSGIGGPGL